MNNILLEKKIPYSECSICYEKIIKRGKLNCCWHLFCINCIKQWKNKNKRCPICRKIFNSIKIYELE